MAALTNPIGEVLKWLRVLYAKLTVAGIAFTAKDIAGVITCVTGGMAAQPAVSPQGVLIQNAKLPVAPESLMLEACAIFTTGAFLQPDPRSLTQREGVPVNHGYLKTATTMVMTALNGHSAPTHLVVEWLYFRGKE